MSTGPRALRVRQRRNIAPGAIPGTPDGALINTLWEPESGLQSVPASRGARSASSAAAWGYEERAGGHASRQRDHLNQVALLTGQPTPRRPAARQGESGLRDDDLAEDLAADDAWLQPAADAVS
ncbi:hypothetical protein [Frankia sp. Cas4]|uniref:hypothetical protein n=1 Tax=Frankia sp. Cas4 TaxID=3073927 RepID=UPI002AD4BB75|nr:hypothetical protein [Frankia sp. Cas4]